jgi:transglutaminase-like putative cysteine protease
MKRLIYWLTAFMVLLFGGCANNHLISDAEYRLKVENDFNKRKELAAARAGELFSPFDNSLSTGQKEALQYLFAYMPFSDLADYDGNFFLANADIALRTRRSGIAKGIPENIFLHYVLPVRVNNENLDSFRIKYSDELLSRINGLDPVKAALEINYWCQEKVAYQAADIRTEGPLSTILSARGRCGEESTFTVAALRTAGIPARQVYTPRWAHSDDNHAWVEFWADGKWYYMGACEPEPVPDRGWFTEPARRAMLVHTISFGAPSGNENSIVSFRDYSVINNLSKYAVTKELIVRVKDDQNHPVPLAKVEFQLYNYAEFYPLAVINSDEHGISRFETGLGDLLIWARKGDQFGFKKITVSEIDTVEISLNRIPEASGYYEYDLGVPVTRTPFRGPSEEMIRASEERVRNGNNIRKAYITSWMKPDEAVTLANETGTDSTVVKEIIKKSMGNFRQISSFIRDASSADKKLAIRLLELVSEKDLRDITEDVLNDHLLNTLHYEDSGKNNYSEDIWFNYVFNPRIANELIVKWRKYLFESIPVSLRQEMTADPEEIVRYTSARIKILDDENYYNTPVTPVGADRLRISDSSSRDIYFVALCRTMGIPARLEPGTSRPQYFSDNRWHDVWFDGKESNAVQKGYIKLLSYQTEPVPEYYIHFTLARFENGRYNTLDYEYNRKITDFREELALDPGFYMLMTGNRINDSRILTSHTFFQLGANEHRTIEVKLRKDFSPSEVIGSINLKENVILSDGKNIPLNDLAKEGLVMIWVEPDKEPSQHIFNDLPLLRKELDAWGGNFLFLTDPIKPGSEIENSTLERLPSRSFIANDNGSALLGKICGGVSCSTVRFPLVIFCDKSGNILLRSEGYRIGIGEQILGKARKQAN